MNNQDFTQDNSLVVTLAFPPSHRDAGTVLLASCSCGTCKCGCPEDVPGPAFGTFFAIDLGIAAGGSAIASAVSKPSDDD